MKFFFSVGEPSGDVHAAELIKTLKSHAPDTQCVGLGGPKMEQAGCRLLTDMTQHAVMWVGNVIKKYSHFRQLLDDTKKAFRSERIDVVVLVDYPGFNWHVARAAKELGIPVVYFMPPQVWAWAQYRVKKMRRLIDLILCPLHFEWQWFSRHGCRAVYIGHPFFEEIRKKQSDAEFLEQFYARYGHAPVLTVLPGSRNQEIQTNLAALLSTLKQVQYELPQIQPIFAAFNDEQGMKIQQQLDKWKMSIPVYVGRTTELIRAADCCLAVSGSVSMELLACNKPTVIHYRVGAFGLFVQRFFRRVRYITLVNLLGAAFQGQSIFYDDSIKIIPKEPSADDRNRMYFPEFLTSTDKSGEMAKILVRWFSEPELLALQKQRLDELLRVVDTIESPLELATRALLMRQFDTV